MYPTLLSVHFLYRVLCVKEVLMEEVNGYNISQKEFNTLSKWTDNIYNLAVIIDYFCENQPEIEELYNLTPVVKSLHRDANVMNAFFINNEKEVYDK